MAASKPRPSVWVCRFLGELPLSLDVRLAGDGGAPVALGEGPVAEAYGKLARGMIAGGMG